MANSGSLPRRTCALENRVRNAPAVGRPVFLLWTAMATCTVSSAGAESAPESSQQVSITATRIAEANDRLPASLTVIDGADLRARGVTDLAGALALVAGVQATPGGDSGPAGAVTSFWGLHEFDAFLLVVDGVPWGGAFNPAIPALDLRNVERIEVLRGAAPVTYGATSFVGVIQVIHRAAGSMPTEARLGFGNLGSLQGGYTLSLASPEGVRQSLSVDVERKRFSDQDRESVDSGRLTYRSAGALAGGTFKFDVDVGLQRQEPPSPIVRQGASLAAQPSPHRNSNPSDAQIRELRWGVVAGYSLDSAAGTWSSTISLARSNVSDIRGFLRPTLQDDGSPNADSQNQRRVILDTYADSQLAIAFARNLAIVVGADLLLGRATQESSNGEYFAPLSGDNDVPSTIALHVDEVNTIKDRRVFLGQYLQADARPTDAWTIDAGLRMTETRESLDSAHVDGFDPTADDAAANSRRVTRLVGALGSSYRVWAVGDDEMVPFVSYRNTFKPAAQDFGPDYRPDILKPEDAVSYELGIKGAFLQGRLKYSLESFLLDFRNLVVTTTDAAGDPLVQNAGAERLKGAELELSAAVVRDLTLSASVSYHDARFRYYVADEGGTNVNAQGKQLPLSPHILASGGIVSSPRSGWTYSLVGRLVGPRFLDIANDARTPGYSTFDLGAGYRWTSGDLNLFVENLSNRRPPVSASEFGDASYYLLPGRRISLTYSRSL